MLKEATKDEAKGVSQKAPKWRNVLFDKSGKSYRGYTLFNNQHEAEAWMQRTLAEHFVPDTQWGGWDTLDGTVLNGEYAWHMQMPVLED